ncbi:MAG: hypothetical protein KDB82_09405 [Planctomycetes bacterium]|nr:hypothetical protein [Planctomycetota bacterium]
MRTLFGILLLAVCASSMHGALTDAQVLAGMDDACASEARWILATDRLSTGPDDQGGDMPRAAYAFERLIRQGNVGDFELLAQSDNDVAVAYGINGLERLAPEKLPALLESLVLRREPFPVDGASGAGRTCVASMLLTAISELARNRAVIGKAWLAYLYGLEDAGGRTVDHEIVQAFAGMIELPRIDPPPASWAYAQAQDAYDDETALRRLVAADVKSVAARLALDSLSDGEQPRVRPDVFANIWRRIHLDAEGGIDMLIHARRWQRARSAMRSRIESGAWVELRGDCPWQTMTAPDWEWLAAEKDPNARTAAESLRGNAIAGWRLDEKPPEDRTDRKIWVLFTLRECTREGSRNAPRAKLLMSDLLTKPGSTLPLCRAIIDGKPLEEHLADVVDAKKLLLLATSALASHQNSERLIGAQLLIVVLRSDVQKDMEFGEYNLLFEPARKLWSICQTLDDASVWDFRVLVLETADRISLDGQDLDVAKTDWVKELAKRMINDPRAMPVTAKLEAFHTDRIYDHLVSRSTEILRGVYEGRAEFLASFEAPERKENERLPNAAEIYKRMQEAAAKLDDE